MTTSLRLRVELRGSRQAAWLVWLCSIATAALVAWLPLPVSVQMPLVIVIGCYALWLIRYWAMRSLTCSIAYVELDIGHRMTLTQRGGRRVEGRAQADSYVGSMLTTVVMRADGARRSTAFAILPDMLSGEDFRKLRVILRHGRAPHDTP